MLFYFNFFLAFLACCALFTPRRARSTLALGALCGGLLALAHLTKAAMLPFIAVFLAAYFGTQVARAVAHLRRGATLMAALRDRAVEVSAGALVAVVFLALLSPYLFESKRHFRSYFYNVNSTFYVWCDGWAQASTLTGHHDDHIMWPHMEGLELPGPARSLARAFPAADRATGDRGHRGHGRSVLQHILVTSNP